MQLINSRISKRAVLGIGSALLLPLLIGYGMIYSLIDNADTKFAKQVDVAVLCTQMSYTAATVSEMKTSIGELSRSVTAGFEKVKEEQLKMLKRLPARNGRDREEDNH